MGMNRQRGNMYPWVTHTWNPIRGKCPHECSYCFMRLYALPELHLAERELQTNLGCDNVIFVGSSTDMWADQVPQHWIDTVIGHCVRFYNDYLFQTKNPKRFNSVLFPPNTFLGTTIESNRPWNGSHAPSPEMRYEAMRVLAGRKMVSIEPVMDFDLEEFAGWLEKIRPQFVSIGADSKGHQLPEPSPKKISNLLEELSKFTEVRLKDNLKRLM